jgi:hypothetical protein
MTPSSNSTNIHRYHPHPHSLLNKKSMTAKEVEKKAKAKVKATHKSAATTQPSLSGKHPATTTATATVQLPKKPLGNFIRSIVVYS